MSRFIKRLKKRADARQHYFSNCEEYARKIGYYYKTKLGDVKIFIFGSVLNGKWHHYSDIDILVVSAKAPQTIGKQAELTAPLIRELGDFNPFEIHLVTPEVYHGWYKNFIKDQIKEIPV